MLVSDGVAPFDRQSAVMTNIDPLRILGSLVQGGGSPPQAGGDLFSSLLGPEEDGVAPAEAVGQVAPLVARRQPGQPLKVQPAEMYALAVFCALEGGHKNKTEQLQVAAVITNRMNADNWVKEFGPGVTDQLFARGQFAVFQDYGLDRNDFGSLDQAAQTLAGAKKIPVAEARETILNFIDAADDAQQFGRAARAVGDNTGFRASGDGVSNVYRRESPYDPKNVGARQPSSIAVNWPGGDNPFR
jgi:hypothetical protein